MITDLLDEFGILYELDGKHSTQGWVNVQCPYCDSESFHMGLTESSANCWKCGKHSLIATLKLLTGLKHIDLTGPKVKHTTAKSRAVELKTPSNVGPMKDIHKNYLRSRGYDPDELESVWGLKGFSGGPWGWRIYIPFYHDHRLVTYQGRAVVKDSLRYRTLVDNLSIKTPKETLYGIDKIRDCAIIVEGVADVWRIGPGALALCGMRATDEQVQIIRNISRKYIMLDNEPQAQRNAKKLAKKLSSFGGKVNVVSLNFVKDAGELTQEQANEIRGAFL